jgi:hypothetical protein
MLRTRMVSLLYGKLYTQRSDIFKVALQDNSLVGLLFSTAQGPVFILLKSVSGIFTE